jgi:hypothetical protein
VPLQQTLLLVPLLLVTPQTQVLRPLT